MFRTGFRLVAKVAIAIVSGSFSVFGSEASANRVVYLEEFDQYGEAVPSFLPGTRCKEWYCGAAMGLEFKPEADGFAHRSYFPIETSPKGLWTLTFKVQNRSDKQSAFSLVLYYGDRKNPKTEEHPFVATKPWWETLSVFSSSDEPLIGWNLKGRVGTNVIVDRVRVEQGVHRAYRLGDPTEWLAAAKGFTPEDLPNDFGSALSDVPVPVNLEKSDLLFKFKPTGRDVLRLATDDKKGYPLTFSLENDTFRKMDPANRRATMTLTNEFLTVSPRRARGFPRVYTRPRIGERYEKPEFDQILSQLDKFPLPKDKVFDLRLTLNDRAEHELWIDGNLALVFTNGPVRAVAGSDAFRMKTAARPKPSLVQPLDFRRWPDGFGLWKVRENRGGTWLGVLDYSCRSCFEAMPDACLFSVPNRPYVKARALCRVATDVPEDFEPVIVARLTSYHKMSYGDSGGLDARACAKAEVRLPRPGSNDPLAKGVVRKGDNLYEVTFDLPIGDMQDILYRGDPQTADGKGGHPRYDQLDFEFTGVLWRGDTIYIDRSSVPDAEVQSSVVVLKGELESAPCDFDCKQLYPFNIYLPEEKAGVDYFIRPYRPGAYEIAWSVSDEWGKVLDKGVERVDGMEKRQGGIRFNTPEVGFYRTHYSFRADGRELWHHDGTYAILPKDDRQAGYDSPYFSWLWTGTHGTCGNFELMMDAFHRMGIRCTWLPHHPETNEVCRKYGVYNAQFGWGQYHADMRPGDTIEQAVERTIPRFRDAVKRYPNTKLAMLFHESGFFPCPKELVGGKTTYTDKDDQTARRMTDQAIATAMAWRAVDPSIKTVLGNSVESYGLLANTFRMGIPKDLVDFVGEETVGMSEPPERNTARIPWIQQEIARLYGYELKSNCPFEWKNRTTRLFVDPGYEVTAFHIRDILIAHALGYTLIPSGGLPGGGCDGYAQSVWSGSKEGRWPLAYPSRTTLAAAVVTALFDRAKFVRLVPTGSLGVYCEEFQVKGKWVYALWTTRGETDVSLDLGENADYEAMSALGHRVVGVKDSTIVVSDEPRYLILENPIAGAKAKLQRRYPREEFAFAKTTVAVPLASADEVVVTEAMDRRFFHESDIFLRMGPFAAKTVIDPLKGACVELTDLSGTNGTPKLVANCTVLKFPNAQPVSGEYDTIGVWVEGNMGDGKVNLEFVDAEGETWATTGPGGVDGDVYDWPGLMSVNFDGWHLLKFPITFDSPVKVPSVGSDARQVTRDGTGNGRIDFPVKVTGLAIRNHPWNLDFLDMRPTRPYVRIKDITLLRSK